MKNPSDQKDFLVKDIPQKVIFFDGICNLCNAWVDFILKFDKKKKFIFSSLQSKQAQEILKIKNYQGTSLSSIILINDQKVYDQSTAVLYILKELGFPWRFIYFFIIVPKRARDFFYLWIAAHRYRFFGKRESCRVPTEEEKDRFIF